MSKMIRFLLAVVAISAAAPWIASDATPARAETKLMQHSNGACGSPYYATGYANSSGSGSTVTAITVRSDGGASCTYRAVQLNWWNGSTYVASGWDEQFAQNAAVGASASFGWAQHRLGYNSAAYDYRETSSWL